MVLFLPFNVAIHDLGGQVSSSACNHNLFAEIESGTSPKFIGAKSVEAFMKEQVCGILREARRAVKAPSERRRLAGRAQAFRLCTRVCFFVGFFQSGQGDVSVDLRR